VPFPIECTHSTLASSKIFGDRYCSKSSQLAVETFTELQFDIDRQVEISPVLTTGSGLPPQKARAKFEPVEPWMVWMVDPYRGVARQRPGH
jgi:hypothetical protein